MAAKQILSTERLILRHLRAQDAPFLVELLNEPAFLRFIGDRQVRNPAQARAYLADGPLAMYERRGFGLFRVELRHGRLPIGICGLVQRDWLADIDLGYALLERYWGRGYAHEAAAATLAYARDHLGLRRIVALVQPDNGASIHLLEKLGMKHERTVQAPASATDLHLYAWKSSG